MLSIATLATSLASFGQAGSGWSLVPWTNPGQSPVEGNRDVHFQQDGLRDFRDWRNEDQLLYAWERTGSNIAGTYEYSVATRTETFRQYGPAAQSANRTEIRVSENYGSGQARQFEAYVTLNERHSTDQAFFQIWGHKPSGGATYLQLRINPNTGNIGAYGGAPLPENITDTDFRNREFKLNIIHIQETRNGSTVVEPGYLEVFIDGRTYGRIRDTFISDDGPEGIPDGTTYFKYGVYGTVGEGNAAAIFKDARYFRDGNVPGTTAQTITFAQPADIPLNGGDVTPGATTTSGLTVSYRSDNPAVATIVAGKIRPVAVGTAKIWAYQDGNGTYAPGRVVVRTINVVAGGVVKQDQTITFPALPTVETGAPDFSPGATASSGLAVTYTSSNTAVATIVGGNIRAVGAGTATITASQAGSATFNPAPNVTRTLTVQNPKQNQTITFPALPPAQYGDPDITPAATASSGLAVSYASSNTAVAAIVAGKIDIIGVGSATITASQAGNASFNPAPAVTQTLTVAKRAQTINFPPLADRNLGAPDFPPGAVATSGLAITYTSSDTAVATIVGGNIRILGTGTTTITAAQAGDANYAAASNATQSLTVLPAPTMITINDRTTGTGLNQFEYFATAVAWKVTSGQAGNYEDDFTESATAGDYAQIRFTGTKIALYGKKKPDSGIAGVSIDGGTESNADFYASTEVKMAKIWESPLLPYGTHILKVRMKNVKNAASTGYLCRIDFVEVKNDSALSYDSIFKEAEGGTLTAPMAAITSTAASGGQYITVASGTGTNATPPPNGSSVITFTATGGTYNIWARTLMPSTAKNSFWVKIDGNAWFAWNDDANIAPDWQWNQITSLNLSAGTHTITIAYREIGTQMDQVLITNDPSFSW